MAESPRRGSLTERLRLLERVVGMRRSHAAAQAEAEAAAEKQPEPGDPRVSPAARERQLEARVAHLESLVEGLQDAMHRETVRVEEQLSELQEQTKPEVMAQALSADARRRGL